MKSEGTERNTRRRAIPVGLEVVIVLTVILGGFALVYGPSLSNSMDRGKQVETMKAMRMIRGELDERLEAGHAYPQYVGSTADQQAPDVFANIRDGWGRPLHVRSDEHGFMLTSFGKDGQPDNRPGSNESEIETTKYISDIVMRNGNFVVRPIGTAERPGTSLTD